MPIGQALVFRTLKLFTRAVLRVHDDQLARVPKQGPLILAINHVNILEIPAIFTGLMPRPVTGLVLAKRWENPAMRWLMELSGAIPLRRGEADVAAMRRAMALLKSGYLVMIAPEGTRSGHGRLQTAHPGVVLLAIRSEVPLLPIVHYGSEDYQANLRRLRRTDFHVVVGRPFRLNANGTRVTRQVRQEMANQVMYQMASILPLAYRGAYSDMSKANDSYLDFE
jgi:1-acyl-sn-glycerol-3-phosphate acyltransferase